MNIICAEMRSAGSVISIARKTIEEIYPKYYPKGAVDFFLAHHNKEQIEADIKAGGVFLIETEEGRVGTVTIKEGEICRLFVLPEYQGKGCGRVLLDFSETEASKRNGKICLDASLPAKEIYLKRGFRIVSSHSIKTENGDFLCYDTMEKTLKSL